MFDFKKLLDGVSTLLQAVEKHQQKSLRANLSMIMFSKIVDTTKENNDADLIAIAKVSVKMADIILRETGEL